MIVFRIDRCDSVISCAFCSRSSSASFDVEAATMADIEGLL
jgi:hypothetical protein